MAVEGHRYFWLRSVLTLYLESSLATRLVVDPGMNYFGWTREEARQFMRENTGQALACQMGKRKLLELRARAEDALGAGGGFR